jgi:hypothetical protein
VAKSEQEALIKVAVSVCRYSLSLFTLEQVGECCGFIGLFEDLTKLQDRWELQTVAFERCYLHIYHRDNL